MGVKVIDKESQQEVEISAAELQADIEAKAGRYVIPAAKLKVTREGNRTGSVSAENIEGALAEGWHLSDDDEHAAARLRREESDLGSQITGLAEEGLAGATFGLSTKLDEALGDDPERMRARRQSTGGLGTAFEIGGALLPSLLVPGSGVAAGAGRGLGRAALATPAGAISRGGALIERGLGAALPAAAPRLVRTLVPVAGRGMVEGFAAGVGSEIDESVLGERDLTAENLLASGGMGALLGGAGGAGFAGISAAGAGLGRVAVKPLREVLGRAMSSGANDAGVGLIGRMASDKNLTRFAHLNSLDPEDALLLGRHLQTPEAAKELDEIIQNPAAYTERVAGDLRTPFEALRTARSKVRQEFGGAQKIRHVEKNLPKDVDALARAHERAIGTLDEVDGAVLRQLEGKTPGQVNASDMRTIQSMVRDAKDEIAAAAANANGKSGARVVAATAHRAVDKVKQGLFMLKDRHRRIVNSGAPTLESQDTLQFFDGPSGLYKRVARSLEDEETWGAAGLAQQEINRLSAKAIDARRNLKGSASGRLLDPRRDVVDNADLLAVAKQAGGRFAGQTRTELLEDAIGAETAYLESAAKHLDLSPSTKSAIAEYRAARKGIDDAFAKQRSKVEKLDAAERWRNHEGNRSPSMGMMSTAGPAVLGALGLSVGGPIGAAVGAVAGMATKPYTLLRKLAAIQARSGAQAGKQRAAISGFLRNVAGKGSDGAKAIGGGFGRGASRAATLGSAKAGTQSRAERLTAMRKRTHTLATNPQALADEIRKMTVGIEDAAPHLATALASKATAIVGFLQSKQPAGYKPAWSNKPALVDPVSEMEYEEYVEACMYPDDVVARLESGSFTAQHAEALRICWPAKYREIQSQCIDALADAERTGAEIPLQDATTMSVLFDAPADPTLPLAQSIAASNAGVAAEQQQMETGGVKQRPAKVDLHASSLATPTQSIGTVDG